MYTFPKTRTLAVRSVHTDCIFFGASSTPR